jgi:hypothetical protein
MKEKCWPEGEPEPEKRKRRNGEEGKSGRKAKRSRAEVAEESSESECDVGKMSEVAERVREIERVLGQLATTHSEDLDWAEAEWRQFREAWDYSREKVWRKLGAIERRLELGNREMAEVGVQTGEGSESGVVPE